MTEQSLSREAFVRLEAVKIAQGLHYISGADSRLAPRAHDAKSLIVEADIIADFIHTGKIADA